MAAAPLGNNPTNPIINTTSASAAQNTAAASQISYEPPLPTTGGAPIENPTEEMTEELARASYVQFGVFRFPREHYQMEIVDFAPQPRLIQDEKEDLSPEKINAMNRQAAVISRRNETEQFIKANAALIAYLVNEQIK